MDFFEKTNKETVVRGFVVKLIKSIERFDGWTIKPLTTNMTNVACTLDYSSCTFLHGKTKISLIYLGPYSVGHGFTLYKNEEIIDLNISETGALIEAFLSAYNKHAEDRQEELQQQILKEL